MKLADTFYTIRSFDSAGDGFRACVELLPDHPVYQGHFPGQPVVPGVLTLALVRECASMHIGRRAAYAAIRECKFISALLPCEGLEIRLDFTLDEQQKLCGTVRRGEEPVLKLNAVLK